MTASQPLALSLPWRGSRLIEASAGTGKTYTIASLYVRLVLGEGEGLGRPLTPPDILVMTFTEAATQELRDRIRRRLAEAARAFRDPGAEPEALLAQLRARTPADTWPACADRLEIAAQWMDDAAVSTIHGWCLRMLREHAFDSGSLFTQTLETDHRALETEAVRDYWRRHCYGLDGVALDWVATHWRTPEHLQSVLAGMPPARAAVETPLGRVLADTLARRQAALVQLKAPWRQGWTDELGDLSDAWCRDKQVDGRKWQAARCRGWLAQIAAWAADPAADALDIGKGFERLTPDGLAEAWRGEGAAPFHPALAAMAALPGALAALPTPEADAVAHAATWVAHRLDAEKRRRAEMGFDDILRRLDEALQGPNGARLAVRIRAQFPVALVDEFQDTDPVQYRILDAVYQVAANRDDCALVLIGDPKQAIYAFRGADLHTYLEARQATAGRHDTLAVNFRSSPAMVAAVNRVFEAGEAHPAGAFLFRTPADDPVPFHAAGVRGLDERWCVDGEEAPALTLYTLLQEAPISRDTYLAQAADGCATEIVRLLRAAQAGDAGFRSGHGAGTWRPLVPADVAVLVRDGIEAAAIRQALAARAVRSVYLSDRDSVFDTVEANDVLVWLRACAAPESERLLRAALATRTLGLSLAALERLQADEARWEGYVLQFRDYRLCWERQGILPMLHRLLHAFALPRRLMARRDGERVLTNLLHLAELLQQASGELDGEQALIRFLAERLADADGAMDAQILRLESDAGLLKVVTVHKSKGLEYPLVFLPFACTLRPVDGKRLPIRYHDAAGALVVDARPDADAIARADQERLAEDLRLLYVALTRARHGCWLGLADLRRGAAASSILHRSAFGYLLGGGMPLPAPAREQALAAWRDAPRIVVQPMPAAAPDMLPAPAAPVAALRARHVAGTAPEPWGIASYSALRIATGEVPAIAADPYAPPSPDSPAEQIIGDDDRLPGEGGEAADISALRTMPALPGAPHGVGVIHDFPRGPQPGTFLHGLLEWAGAEGFPAALGNAARRADTLAARCRLRGWQRWAPALDQWLAALLQRPVPLPGGGAVSLAGLSAYQMEMEFWFESRRVDTGRLDRLVREGTWPGQARPPIETVSLNGMFKGFIDLCFEHGGRYYVADYKSNWLGPQDGAYTADALRAAMLAHRYDLQYVLYLLALHRQLRARLPGYDYDRHMGGAVYLFLRGTGGPAAGTVAERPPRALIEQLDALFRGREEAHP